MTILACAAKTLDDPRPPRDVRTVVYGMALGAQPRPRNLQQIFVHGAVRVMTGQAIFPHRRVLEQKWPALFGVALITSVVDRACDQQRFGSAAVRIMTIRAH